MSAAMHVIDVAHGNCAVAADDGWALMVDAAPSAAVIEAVAHLELDRLDAVVISHRDYDHAGGLVPLLARKQLEIGAVQGVDQQVEEAVPDADVVVILGQDRVGA